MQVTTGRYHTLLIRDSSVYSCGSSLCGVLGHGAETTQCVAFTRIRFPSLANVVQVSASHNHAAFVLQSGEVCSHSYFISHLFCSELIARLNRLKRRPLGGHCGHDKIKIIILNKLLHG